MQSEQIFLGFRVVAGSIALAAFALLAPKGASAQTETVLHSFDDATGDAEMPYGGLVGDAAGNFYGTGSAGGATFHNLGAVFELTPSSGGGLTESLVHTFNGIDGYLPIGTPVLDGNGSGNLYGITAWGGGEGISYCGQDGCGVVFEVTRGTDGRWIEKVLHRFNYNGKDGVVPYAGLILDAAGNLYGTTAEGGTYDGGTVFELTPKTDGSWGERILHNFGNGTDGTFPRGSLIFDSAGNLYGTTSTGGVNSDGTVFELMPRAGGGWEERVLHSFSHKSTDGRLPIGGLSIDNSGNLYGTTAEGGSSESCVNYYIPSCGAVFELMPRAGGGWAERVIHNFVLNTTDGVNPESGVIIDSAGNLYGTTYYGGAYSAGIVFELSPGADGTWTETNLHSFGDGTDGQNPDAGLIFGTSGNIYGTTLSGGAHAGGTAFEITP